MDVVVVSAPGSAPVLPRGGQHRGGTHWSVAWSHVLVGAAVARGDHVRWLCVGASAPPLVPGADVESLPWHAPRSLARVAAATTHVAVERRLSQILRERPRAAVVHVGVGAGGSPNVLWLAERLGSPAFAVVRAAEVVCHRGDLIDRDGKACSEHEDPLRCRWCCCTSFWRRAPVVDFANRADLLFAGLAAAERIFVPDEGDAAVLVAAGLPRAVVALGHEPSTVLQNVLATAAAD
jgi:hypothetical protein